MTKQEEAIEKAVVAFADAAALHLDEDLVLSTEDTFIFLRMHRVVRDFTAKASIYQGNGQLGPICTDPCRKAERGTHLYGSRGCDFVWSKADGVKANPERVK